VTVRFAAIVCCATPPGSPGQGTLRRLKISTSRVPVGSVPPETVPVVLNVGSGNPKLPIPLTSGTVGDFNCMSNTTVAVPGPMALLVIRPVHVPTKALSAGSGAAGLGDFEQTATNRAHTNIRRRERSRHRRAGELSSKRGKASTTTGQIHKAINWHRWPDKATARIGSPPPLRAGELIQRDVVARRVRNIDGSIVAD
jgi:hypothetical protein